MFRFRINCNICAVRCVFITSCIIFLLPHTFQSEIETASTSLFYFIIRGYFQQSDLKPFHSFFIVSNHLLMSSDNSYLNRSSPGDLQQFPRQLYRLFKFAKQYLGYNLCRPRTNVALPLMKLYYWQHCPHRGTILSFNPTTGTGASGEILSYLRE